MNLELKNALIEDNIEKTILLLENYNEIDRQDDNGKTLLMYAVENNSYKTSKILLDKGASPNVKDNSMLSPWLCAGANGFHKLLKLMLEYNPEINSTNRFGGTVLLPSSEKGYLKTVEIALKANVSVNHVNDLGWSALQEAVILGNGGYLYKEIIRLLMKNGANPNLKDNEGKTSLDWASARKERDVLGILRGGFDDNHQLITSLISQESYEEAIEQAYKLDNLEGIFFMGYCYSLLDKHEDSLYYYNQGLRHRSGQPEFLFYIANVYRTMKKVEEALMEYDKAIDYSPYYFFYRYHKSNYLRELGRHEEAIAEMDILLSMDPYRYDYLFHKANSLRSLGKHDEAVDVIEKAIEIDPNNNLYKKHKAKSYELMGEFKKAKKILIDLRK